MYQSSGNCQAICVEAGYQIFALTEGSTCYCGNNYPNGSDKTSDSACNSGCLGFGQATCGGKNAWAVYSNGDVSGGTAAPAASSLSTPSTSASQVVATIYVTQGGNVSAQTIVTTEVASTSNNGPNKAAIAAGVVVGVVILLAAIGGLIFFLRQRKKREAEEEMRRHNQVASFVGATEKPPSVDSRLEPSVMFQRRMSDGSIMDNQDYSRRILKVSSASYHTLIFHN
jgi:cell wall integrity and stress response component